VSTQLQGTSGIPGLSDKFNAFIQTMRLWMRDYPHLNRLIRGEESSNRLIAWAVVDFLSDFNGTPPLLGQYTLEQMLDMGFASLARYGTAIALIQSVGFLQTRNQLNFSDGGINVAINDKTPMLIQWLDRMQSKYEQDKIKVKVSLNINNILGEAGVHSEFWFINSFMGSLFQ
jgi:hypothetical protein